ncbi:hypothetical protein HQ529_03125, partial [Candidatus Woesearchaeota archaeon]|nr:hypothetical protein [Candidatus Woesearchaeota archaeon]
DNGCFKYTSTAIFRVTDNKPGGWLTKASDSHKILTSQSLTTKSWDECSPSNTIVVSSGDWVVRGSSRTVRPEAKYISYRDDSCWGDKSYGSEGQMTIGLIVERANYVIGYDYKSTVCDYECEKTSDCGSKESVGERYCSGKNIVQDYSVPKCVKYDCELNDLTETIKTCSNSCEDGVCVTFDDDEEEEEICLTVCVEMYEIIDNKCVFDNCGSGCGVNEVTTFDTKKECENNLEKPPIECAISEDCKEIAKVVCDDKSLWYHDYSCVNGVCAISLDIPPESCIRGGEDEEKTSWLIYLIPIVSGFVLILFIFIISNFIKRRKR